MKTYDAYLFDLYGTLVDIHTDESKPGFWKKVAAFYRENGADYVPEDLRETYLRLCDEETERLCRLQSCTDWEVEIDLQPVFDALYRLRGIEASEKLVAETAWFFRQSATMHLRAYAGAHALLQSLRGRGKKVFLLSNAQALFTRPELAELGLDQCFDCIYISSDAGWHKPARQFIQCLLDQQGLDPKRCLMIGNDPIADVGVARSVGMDCLYLHSNQSPRIDPNEVPADYVQPFMDLRLLKRKLCSDL